MNHEISDFFDPEGAEAYIDAAFADVAAVWPVQMSETEIQRFKKFGVQLVGVIYPDRFELDVVPFDFSPGVQALENIRLDEDEGIIGAGSYNNALETIKSGEFMDAWGFYLKNDQFNG